MRVLVLLAGIVETNWRLDASRVAALVEGDEAGPEPRRLGPFDEAALETALQLRDRDAAVSITAAVLGGPGSDKLARAAMAFRPARALRVDVPSALCHDPAVAAAAMQAALAASGGADLVLAGRELGDCDNGMAPAYAAERCGWRFFGRVHRIHAEDGRLVLSRVRDGDEEQAILAPPLMASVVNDRGNRLRHPLMKNVILARREPVEVVATGSAAPMPLVAAGLTPFTARSAACRMIEGSVDDQAAALAALLRPPMGLR